MSKIEALTPPPKLAVPKHPRRYLNYPSLESPLLLEVVAQGAELPLATRGHLRRGRGSISFHREVPVDGTAVRIDAVAVVEMDAEGEEVATPYLDWCRNHGLFIRCHRCRQNILDTAGQDCPEIVARRKRQLMQEQAQHRLDSLRERFAASPENATPPLRSAALPDAHNLRTGIDSLEEARQRALEYSYDYSGVHIVRIDGHYGFDLYAIGFRDVPGAGADSASLTNERDWPISILG